MDGKAYAQKPKNPREGANPLSAITFGYILRLFWVGYRRDLDIQDLYEPLKEHKSNLLGEKIARLWEQECERIRQKQLKIKSQRNGKDDKIQPSLLRVLLRCFGFKLVLYGVLLAVMEILLRLMQPILLGLLISYFGQRGNPNVLISINNDNISSNGTQVDDVGPSTSLSAKKKKCPSFAI